MGSEVVILLSALAGVAGVITAIAAYRKVQPETQSIIVTAAQGAVIVQSGVIDDLREELARCHTKITALEDELHSETDRLRRERDDLRLQLRASEEEKVHLLEVREELEARVQQLEARVDELETSPSNPS